MRVAFATLAAAESGPPPCVRSLAASDGAAGDAEWHVAHPDEHGGNATRAFNAALDATPADWCVAVARDVWFPGGWLARFRDQIASLPADVAVAGVLGCEAGGAFRGHIHGPRGHRAWPGLPAYVLTLDDCLVAVRTSSGLRFDADLPGVHCHGSEIGLRANAAGARVAVIDAPVRHAVPDVPDRSWRPAARYLLGKWAAAHGGVLPTPARLLGSKSPEAVRRFGTAWRVRRGSRMAALRHCRSAACRELSAADSGVAPPVLARG